MAQRQLNDEGETQQGAPRIAAAAGVRWYVAQTLLHGEERALAHLRQQDFCAFFPKLEKTVRHARRVRMVRAPLFPNYVFVQFDPDQQRWRSINGTVGVRKLIMANEAPVPVQRGIVEALLEAIDDHEVMRFGSHLKPGEDVRILSGPFADAIGSLERLNADGRVQVLMQFMGREVRATVSASKVIPAKR